ncbi:hypothetical protein OC845_000677 [Tilletia horrida]|nr:hypothetical protein OC845_000677 [Tilletia horrida]
MSCHCAFPARRPLPNCPALASHRAKGKGNSQQQSLLLSSYESIPFEIHQHILTYLNPSDLVQVAAASKTLRTVALADPLWKHHVYDVIASSPPVRNPWITPFHAAPSAWQVSFQAPETPPWSFPANLTALAQQSMQNANRKDDNDGIQDLRFDHGIASSHRAQDTAYRIPLGQNRAPPSNISSEVLVPLHPDQYQYEAIKAEEESRRRPPLSAFPGAQSFYEVYVHFLQPVAHLLGWWVSDAPNFGGVLRFVLDLAPDADPQTGKVTSSSNVIGPTIYAQRLHFTNRLAAIDARNRQTFPAVSTSVDASISNRRSRAGVAEQDSNAPMASLDTTLWQALTSFTMPAETYLGPPTILRYDNANTAFNVDIMDPAVRTEPLVTIRWTSVRKRIRAQQSAREKMQEMIIQQAHSMEISGASAPAAAQTGRALPQTTPLGATTQKGEMPYPIARSTMRCWPIHPAERAKVKVELSPRTQPTSPSRPPVLSTASVDSSGDVNMSNAGSSPPPPPQPTSAQLYQSDEVVVPFSGWSLDRPSLLATPSSSSSHDHGDNLFAFDASRSIRASRRRAGLAVANASTDSTASTSAASADEGGNDSPVTDDGDQTPTMEPIGPFDGHVALMHQRHNSTTAFAGPWAPVRGSTTVRVPRVSRDSSQQANESVTRDAEPETETYDHVLFRETAAISSGLRNQLDSDRISLRTQRGVRTFRDADRRHAAFMRASSSVMHAADPRVVFGRDGVEIEHMPAAIFPSPGLLPIVRARASARDRRASLDEEIGDGHSQERRQPRADSAFSKWERDGLETRLDQLHMVPSPPYISFSHPRLGPQPMPSGPRWFPVMGPARLPPWDRQLRCLPRKDLNEDDEERRRRAKGWDYWNDPVPARLDPASYEFDWDSLEGLYAQTYGPHGIELVYVRSRILTAADFGTAASSEGGNVEADGDELNRRRTPVWAPEPLFTSDDMYVDQLIDRSAVVPGARVVEAIKVTGDPNVPRGQVTWRAFVSDPRIRRTPWRPPKPGFRNHLPWPFVETASRWSSNDASRNGSMQADRMTHYGQMGGGGGRGAGAHADEDDIETDEEDAESVDHATDGGATSGSSSAPAGTSAADDDGQLHHPGLVAVGHGRVAGDGFAGAAWASTMVLLSPQEIRVWWQPMMKFAVARKLYGM